MREDLYQSRFPEWQQITPETLAALRLSHGKIQGHLGLSAGEKEWCQPREMNGIVFLQRLPRLIPSLY